ncbi:hypothetical protein H6503_01395 [Candidatus Woesearchaeota archaeon]|nr:hypothetical protein [Candidatus Woesearchaeota archaeon]
MLDLRTCLNHYKRSEVQDALIQGAKNRELGTRYLDGHFGKRPDSLQNKADVLEFAKQGVSSFHISEEHWSNPLALSSTLKKSDLIKMRRGWDLVVDVDCPDWELSKRITFVIIKILKKHGIKSISCKFSGNKGFHIGVPFKAFPKAVNGKSSAELFPEKVKKILEYLVYVAEKEYSAEILQGLDSKQLSGKLDIPEHELAHEVCIDCNTLYKSRSSKLQYMCDKCGTITEKEAVLSPNSTAESFISCPKCKSIVRLSTDLSRRCVKCGSSNIGKKINLKLVLGLDQVLISPRHLYRMALSLHEKSGLVSLPINPFSVLAFEKSMASPEKMKCNLIFLDDSSTHEGEAADFLLKALDFKPEIVLEFNSDKWGSADNPTNWEDSQERIPIELFPPSIINILKGLKDGKKRALFVLINFLTSVGWDYPEVDELLHEWNKKNQDPLRETVIKTQLSYHKIQKKKVLPPNYSNHNYYADLGIISAEEANGKFKNPVNYAKMRAKMLNSSKKRKKTSQNPATTIIQNKDTEKESS